MIFVFFAALLCLATLLILRPSMSGAGPISLSGFDGVSVIVGFIFFVAIAATIGLPFGLPLILSLLLHELGQVLAHRMLGSRSARFRLIPLLRGEKISDEPLKTDGEVFLVAILGPALSLGPIALALTLSAALSQPYPAISQTLWLFAATCGTVNFIMLLPFWPFDGAKCVRTATANFWPALAPAMTVFMSTALATASLRTGSIALMAAAGFGAQSLLHRGISTGNPMSPDNGLIALAAYAFTMAAHFSVGWMLLSAYF